jgi:hypothetical protein
MSEPLLIISLPTQGEASLTLPGPLTRELLTELEQTIPHTLQQWRHQLGDAPVCAGDIEYASWVLASRF